MSQNNLNVLNLNEELFEKNQTSTPSFTLEEYIKEGDGTNTELNEKCASTEENIKEKSEGKTKVNRVTIKSKSKSHSSKLKFLWNDANLKRLKKCNNFMCKQKGLLYEITLPRKEMKKLEKAGFFKNPKKAKTIKNITINAKKICYPKKKDDPNDIDFLEQSFMYFNIESGVGSYDYGNDDEKFDPENFPEISSNHGING